MQYSRMVPAQRIGTNSAPDGVAEKPGEEKLFLEISRAFAETQSVM